MLHVHDEEPGLRQLLHISRASEATDPKDHVFALLGLAKGSDDPDLEPDYRLLWGYVYFRAARALLLRHDLMTVLAYKGISITCLPAPYPSWIPEWYDRSRLESFMSKSREAKEVHGRPLYSAGGSTASDGGFLRGTALHQLGIVFDTIHTLEEGVREYPFSTDEIGQAMGGEGLGRFQRWFVACADIARSCVPYPSGGGTANAFVRTLFADSTIELARAPAKYATRLISTLSIFDHPELKAEQQEVITLFAHAYTSVHGEPPEIVECRDMTVLCKWLYDDLAASTRDCETGSPAIISTSDAGTDTSHDRDTAVVQQMAEKTDENVDDSSGTEHLMSLTSACQGRLFCATTKRYLGLVP